MASKVLLLSMPDEVLTDVIRYISDEDIFGVIRVCKRLYNVANSWLQWRERCLRFCRWEPKHKIQEKINNPLPLEVNWKSLFTWRWNVNRKTSVLLKEIISSSSNRIPKFHKIGSFGYDALEYLVEQTKASEDLEDVLARRWFATSALQFLHRRRAVNTIRRISANKDVSIEEGLGIFDLFNIEIDENGPEGTAQILDELATRFTSQTSNMAPLPIKTRALGLCQFMKQEGFRGANSEEYRKLQNCYIGTSLRTTRVYIPLTSAAIYCSLAQRIGLSAYLCGFPYHVLAIVKDENGENIYVDPFHSEGHGRIRDVSELEDELEAFGIIDKHIYLCPSPIRDMVLRTSRNLLESLRHGANPDLPINGRSHSSPVSRRSAIYAALMTSVLLGEQNVIEDLIFHLRYFLTEEIFMDVQFFEEDVLQVVRRTRLSRENTQMVKEKCDDLRMLDSTVNPPRRRSEEKQVMKYKVGTVFVHKIHRYHAIVFGWTPSCEPKNGEAWIKEMGVDKLQYGRYQPFYHSLVDDESERYVAEENIIRVEPGVRSTLASDDLQELCQIAGKHFKRYLKRDGIFVPNDESAYPEG